MKIHTPYIKALIIGLISALTLTSHAYAREITWTGATNDIWQTDTNVTNWANDLGDSTFFEDGDIVNFNPINGAQVVNISGDVAPQSIKVGGGGNVIFEGTGSITGTGSLLKTGTGMLTLETENSYSGGTTLEDEGIDLQSASGLGTGKFTMHNGTWLFVANGLTVHNEIALNGSKVSISSHGATTFSGKLSTDQSVTLSAWSSSLTFTGALEVAAGHTLTLANGNFTMSNNTVDARALTVGSNATLKLESSTLTGLTISEPSTESFTTSEGGIADSSIYTLSGIADLIKDATGSLTLNLGPLADFDITKGITGFEIEGLSALPSSLGYNNIILNINGSSYNVLGANAGLAGSTNIVLYIPEPSTATLSLLSLAGLMLRRRRKAA